jgi:parallel beta-helix repeat protein
LGYGHGGIALGYSSGNVLYRNSIENNGRDDGYGVVLEYSSNNTISENVIADHQGEGLYVGWYLNVTFCSSYNRIYHNSFRNNTIQAYTRPSAGPNFWDNGYLDGGNYWSDYAGTDAYSGSNQNETGFDWIGDTPYIVDQNNTDRYPLTQPFVLGIEETHIAYRNLLLRFAETRSQLEALNSTLVGLTDEITRTQSQLDSLNETVSTMSTDIHSLNDTIASLQQQTLNLNSTLSSTHSGLQTEISALSTQVSDLQERLDSLNSTLQSSTNTQQNNYDSLSNQLTNILNVTYALVATVIVLLLLVTYLIARKPKTKPET